MRQKHEKIAGLIDGLGSAGFDPHYLGFFRCFNAQLYFEAHEVLEVLWLEERHSPLGLFYKGLIQLAGAFVHVQKGRPGPALALLELARVNLARYPGTCLGLETSEVLRTINHWQHRLDPQDAAAADLLENPQLGLIHAESSRHGVSDRRV